MPKRKLTADAVIDIRRRAEGETKTALALEYGVSRKAIAMVVDRVTYAHV